MFEKLLSKIGTILKKYNIPYMVIGGQAVLLYGEPRLTRDIDITLGFDIDRLDNLLTVIHELKLKPLPEDMESFVKETRVLPARDEGTGIRVDFIFSFTPYEAEAISRACSVEILGQEVSFASPEDLIIHKIFAGRPRDLEDVRSILLRIPDMDKEYIKARLEEFDQASDEKHFLDNFERIISEL